MLVCAIPRLTNSGVFIFQGYVLHSSKCALMRFMYVPIISTYQDTTISSQFVMCLGQSLHSALWITRAEIIFMCGLRSDAYGAFVYACEFDGHLIIDICISKRGLSRRSMNHRSHVAGLSYAISLRRWGLSGPSASFTPYGIIFGLCMHVRLVSLKA